MNCVDVSKIWYSIKYYNKKESASAYNNMPSVDNVETIQLYFEDI